MHGTPPAPIAGLTRTQGQALLTLAAHGEARHWPSGWIVDAAHAWNRKSPASVARTTMEKLRRGGFVIVVHRATGDQRARLTLRGRWYAETLIERLTQIAATQNEPANLPVRSEVTL